MGLGDRGRRIDAVDQNLLERLRNHMGLEDLAGSARGGCFVGHRHAGLGDVDELLELGPLGPPRIVEQLGIDPQETFGYRIIEPLIQIRKDGVRKIGKALGLPSELFERIPFPGPALSARVIGAVTPELIETVRKATTVVERLLKETDAFQYMVDQAK